MASYKDILKKKSTEPLSRLGALLGAAVVLPLFSGFWGIFPRPVPLGLWAILFLFFVWVIRLLYIQRIHVPLTVILIWLLLTMSMGFSLMIGLPFSSNPYYSILMFVQPLLPVTGLIVAYSFVKNTNDYYWFGISALTVAILTALAIFVVNLESFIGLSKFRFQSPAISFFDLHMYQFRQYQGSVMAAAIPLCMLAVRTLKGKVMVLVSGILVTMAVFGMHTAAGRIMSLIALAVVGASFFPKRFIMPGIMMTLTLFILAFSFVDPLKYELLHAVNRFQDMGNRFPIWEWSLQSISEYPWFGLAYTVSFGQETIAGAHNQFFNYWVRAGILTAFLWVTLLGWMLWRTVGLLRIARNSDMWWGYFGLATAFFMQSVLNSFITVPFEQPYTGIFIWCIYGLIERARVIEKQRLTSYSFPVKPKMSKQVLYT